MNDEEIKRANDEMIKDAKRLTELVENNPDFKNLPEPSDMHGNIFKVIRRQGEIDKLIEREKELIQLGLLYERKRRKRKYYVFAAVMVLVLALGITSMGGAEKVIEIFKIRIMDREQVQINSGENVDVVDFVDEEVVYEEIEKEFGFRPVKLEYLPEGIEFQEATISEEVQGIYMIYGKEENAYIKYLIRPNYRESSWGLDVEDELLNEYLIDMKDTMVQVRKYLVEDGTKRWAIQFEYKDINYFILINLLEQNEVEKIINNLYFF